MKVVIILICSVFSLSCVGQNREQKPIKDPIESKMEENLYIPEVDSVYEVLNKHQYLPKVDGKIFYKEENDDHTLFIKEDENGFYLDIIHKDSYFNIVKTYYKYGGIKMKGVIFKPGNFQKGTWYYFDSLGNITETIDHDKLYTFSFEKLHKLLQKKNISLTRAYQPLTGFHTHIMKLKDSNGEPVWYVRWLKNPTLIGTMTIDGRTGEILKTEDLDYINN